MGHYLEFNARTQTKGASPVSQLRGGSSPTSVTFDGAVTSDSPSPTVLFPVVFSLLLLFLRFPERTYSHTMTRENLVPFCRDFVHFHRRDIQQLYGLARGKV